MGHLFHKLSAIEFSPLPLKSLDIVMVRDSELDLIFFAVSLVGLMRGVLLGNKIQ